MTKESSAIKVKPAKGRPMLMWVGKRPLTTLPVFPAQRIEQYGSSAAQSDLWSDWPNAYPRGGLLLHGDNKEVLANLIANGFRAKVDLVYIDPPFDSGADYVRRVQLRGASTSPKLDGEGYELGEQIQYTDIWANDNYLQFMYERLILIKELLAANSNFVLHCDWHRDHLLRALCDEVFGEQAFANEVYWYFYNKMHDSRKGQLPRATNTLLVYTFGDAPWADVDVERPEVIRQLKRVKVNGVLVNLRDDEGNLVYQDRDSKTLDNVWPIPAIPPADKKQKTSYPTQKPRALLDLVISTYSNPGSVVLDCFVGSGTTAESAQHLGRRWIAADINKGAIQETTRRVLRTIEEQEEAHSPMLLATGVPERAQTAFSVWRVNDYDLHVQEAEAVALACEHLGVERTPADEFFDGRLGKELVRIISFDHPLSPEDLEQIRDALDSRPDETRNVTVVALGAEFAALDWIDDWNAYRRTTGSPNRISLIELRTDPKYGRIIAFEPPHAEMSVKREDGTLIVTVTDFVSPSIVARLKDQDALLAPKIKDWRAMVDSIAVDFAYEGSVFEPSVLDFPERKADLVSGVYTAPAPGGDTVVALRITDMLGGEAFVTENG